MPTLSGEHVLVTGGAGFIGSALVRTLLQAGAAVTVADLHPSRVPGVSTVQGELRDPDVQRRAVHSAITAVLHLAARTSVLQSMRDPAEVHAVNVEMTAGLLEQARRVGVKRFLFASTNAVVGDRGGEVLDEDVALRPLTPYGGTKAAAEMLLSAYGSAYGLQTCSLRLTNVYGPGMQRKDSFVPRLMRAALRHEQVTIYGDGRQRRDLVHVDDVCRAFLLAWEHHQCGPLVVGSGTSVTVLDLVDAARDVTGRPLPARHVAPKAGEMRAVAVRIDRARAIGYEPRVSLRDGLLSVWADFQAHPDEFRLAR